MDLGLLSISSFNFSTCLIPSSSPRTSAFTMKLHEFSQFIFGLLHHFDFSRYHGAGKYWQAFLCLFQCYLESVYWPLLSNNLSAILKLWFVSSSSGFGGPVDVEHRRSPESDVVFFIFIFIGYAITVFPISPLYSPPLYIPPPTRIPPFWFIPWVIHI